MDKYIGKRLEGRYEIQEIIGVGGMAVVYKAYDNLEDRIVAVKILKEEYVSNDEFIRRFKNESKAIAVMSHPNIVKVYDVSIAENIQYIVMEYIDGITLKELIEKQGSLRWKDALYFAVQILKGLQHAHDKGIVHRDVKPQNIIVLSDGTLKVTDFGIARFARSEQKTITDKAIGSVHYISPEQARGENTDEKADIYSVGVILYEMLTGQLPFQAESAVSVAIMQLQRDPELPTSINGSIPRGLEQITMHAMQKSTDSRYSSAAEMLCDLENFKKDPSITFEYDYFVDDSPTKFVDGDLNSGKQKSKKQKSEKNSSIPILAGIAATFFCVLIILGFIFLPKLFGGTGEEIVCPNFIGQNYYDIMNSEEFNSFNITPQFGGSNEYDKNVVYGQSIPAKRKIKKGATITLNVSSGPESKIPEISVNTPQNKAISELKTSGYNNIEVVAVNDDNVPVGCFIRTDPAANTPTAESAKVTVYVSLGKERIPTELPDCIGLNEADACKRLKDKGLIPAVSTEYRDNPYKYKNYRSKDTVIAVKLENDDGEIYKGCIVNVYLSSGNIKVKLDVNLPVNLPFESGTISLWSDSEHMIQESKTVDFTKLDQTYTFEFVSSSVTMENCYIKVKKSGTEEYLNYQQIAIDCKESRIMGIVKQYTID